MLPAGLHRFRVRETFTSRHRKRSQRRSKRPADCMRRRRLWSGPLPPSAFLLAHGLACGHLPTGVNHRTVTQGFPLYPPGAPKGACNAHKSERPATRPMGVCTSFTPLFDCTLFVFSNLMGLVLGLSSVVCPNEHSKSMYLTK